MSEVKIIEGVYHVKGHNPVGLHIKGPAIIKPGTVVIAEGTGKVTATIIGGEAEEKKR